MDERQLADFYKTVCLTYQKEPDEIQQNEWIKTLNLFTDEELEICWINIKEEWAKMPPISAFVNMRLQMLEIVRREEEKEKLRNKINGYKKDAAPIKDGLKMWGNAIVKTIDEKTMPTTSKSDDFNSLGELMVKAFLKKTKMHASKETLENWKKDGFEI